MTTYRELDKLRDRARAAPPGRAGDPIRRAYAAALDALPTELDPELPLLLLPVRLETRIRGRTDGAAGDELVVRIFPDDVHINTHDPGLTADEIRLGAHFWRQRWFEEAGGRPAQPVWDQFAGLLGPARAAWVARVMTPRNLPPVPGAEPDLPEPAARALGERPATADALPDRWVVRAWRAGVLLGEARGGLVTRPLVAGPPVVGVVGPQDWMTELEAAFNAGMAVVVRPQPPIVLDRVDVVTAIGVRATDSPDRAAAHLRDLFDAHQFAPHPGGAGLDLVPQGTPTNNTPAVRAPARGDPSSVRSGAARTGPVAATRGDGSDADLLASALGLPDREPLGPGDTDLFPLGRLEHAAGTDQRDAAAMATVLWPATWGYYLRQFAAGVLGLEPDADLGVWRRFVIDTVRGRGPLPALRVLDQPYGVLPVLPGDRWQAAGGQAAALVDLVTRARVDWQTATGAVPRVGRVADPTDDLLDLLATDAVSGRVLVRNTFGTVLLANMWLAAGRPFDPFRYVFDLWQEARALPESWGLLDPAAPDADDPVGKPRLGRSAHEPLAVEFLGALAGSPAGTDALAFAARARPDELHAWTMPPGASLVDHLVRHSTLQAWADAALALRPPDNGDVHLPPYTEPELVDLADLRSADPVEAPVTPTAWRHLDRATMPPTDPTWPGAPVKQVVADLLKRAEGGDLLAQFGAGGRRVRELDELRRSLRSLADRPTAVLARAFGEALDLASHRLDAWLTAPATARLRALRRARPTGIHLGGFGVVVDLRPRTRHMSEGYVHAPSVGQAATAAVLRSGYLTHADAPLGQRLALNLTSRRVRLALELADGVRAGHQLGALLGYRLERGLHERSEFGLAQYLPALRQLAPLAAGKRAPVPESTSVDAVAAPVVVDGLALLRAAGTIPWGQKPAGSDVALPPTDSDDHKRLRALLDDLLDAADALGDLGVAEAVHQAVHGNAAAAGGALDVLSGGEVVAADPDVVRTPVAGTGVTHRLLIALPDPADAEVAAAVARWKGGTRPRGRAMPRLDAWAATVLPDPGATRWRASWRDPDGVPRAAAEYTLAAVGLCALDLVQFAATPDVSEPQGGVDAGRGDLERLLALHAATHAPAGAVGTLRLNLERDAEWPAGTATVGEMLEVARAARELVAHGRPVAAGDLTGPVGARPDDGLNTAALAGPADDAATDFADAVAALRAPFGPADPAAVAAAYPQLPADRFATLENLLDLPTHLDPTPAMAATGLPGDLDAVRDALRRLAAFGVAGAAPASPAGATDADAAALTAQARQVAADAAARGDSAGNADGPVETLAALFGPGFPIVPELAVPAAKQLADAFDARVADATELVVADWLEGAAHVRAGAARLADLCLLAEAGAGLAVAQLPARPGDWWVALPTPPKQQPVAGVVAMVFAGRPFDPADAFAGLLVDEWVEVVPARRHDTAVAFHVDAPGARAPQTMLLACAADPARRWDDDELEHVVLDTLELALIRAVDNQLGPGGPPAGHYLPGLLLARNTGGDAFGDTVATTLPQQMP